MTVIIINPNSTATMTEAMVNAAQRAVPELTFEGWTSFDGPPAIQGEADGIAATAPLLHLVKEADASGAQGIIIGCFDDTALQEASALASCPVIGIGQAAYHYAALRNWRFSVVTTLAASVPVLEKNISAGGLGHILGKVRSSEVPVLALETDPATALEKILDQAIAAEKDDDADAVILGCGGMVHITEAARAALKANVLDPLETAATCMRWLVAKV